MEITGEYLKRTLSSGNSAIENASNFTFDQEKFFVRNLRVSTEALIETLGTNDSIEFENCVFEKTSFAPKHHSTALIFKNCSFNQNVTFSKGKNNNISFNKCHFNNLFFVDGEFAFIGVSESNGKISIYRSKFDHLIIGDWINPELNHLESLDISLEFNMGVIQVLRSIIGTFTIRGILAKESTFVVDEIKVKHFKIKWLNVIGTLKVNNVKADLASKYIINYSDFKHSEIEREKINKHYAKPLFLIYKSDLSKSYFNSVAFNTFLIVSISESNVSEINFINIQWPTRIFSFKSLLEKNLGDELLMMESLSKEKYFEIRDNYRQLKLASLKQSDFISEQFFHAKEMDSYNKSLKWSKNFWIKIILKLSSITSDYGQSFIKPFASLFLVTAFFYTILLMTISTTYASCDVLISKGFLDISSEIVRLANPLHVNRCELKGFSFLIDTINRIFSSYLIYNIIRATRRFVR